MSQSHGHEKGHGAKPEAKHKPDAKPNQNPHKAPEVASDKESLRKAKILRVWSLRIGMLVALLGGAGAAMIARQPDIDPNYDISDAEKEEAGKINEEIEKIGGERSENGNIIPPRLKEKVRKGKIVALKWPGKRRIWKVTSDGKLQRGDESPQIIRINESCVERMENFRRCVNKTLHMDPRIISGFQSNGLSVLRSKQMGASNKIDPKDAGGPLTTGQCAFELSALDASRGNLPYKTNDNGWAEYLIDQKVESDPEREVIKNLLSEASRGQIGAHVLAQPCAIKNGISCAHCGPEKGNPFSCIAIDELPPEHPSRTCKEDSDLWRANKEYLRENPVSDFQDDIDEELKTINKQFGIKGWSKAGRVVKETVDKAYEKGKEGVGKGWEWTKDTWRKYCRKHPKTWGCPKK